MADPKSNAQFCERCFKGRGVGCSPWAEDHVRWVRCCQACFDEYDAAVEADRAMLVESDRWAAWRAQAEAVIDA